MAERSRGARRLLPVPVPLLLVLLLLLLMAGSTASPADEGGGGRREAGGGEPGDEAAPHDSSYGTFASEFYDLRYLSEEGALRGRDGTGRHGTGQNGTGQNGTGRGMGEPWGAGLAAAALFSTKASARRHLLPAAACAEPAGTPQRGDPTTAGTPQHGDPHSAIGHSPVPPCCLYFVIIKLILHVMGFASG